MTSRQRRLRPYLGTLAVALLCTVAGCNRPAQVADTQNVLGSGAPATGAPMAALPLTTATPPPMPLAPAATALPRSHRMVSYSEIAPNERYRYLDDAYAMGDAFGDSPPDYTVDYGGTQPWIWRAENGAYRVIEYAPGGPRDYYYAPGADEPFLVRDSGYAYAYRGARLVGVYDPDGRMLATALAAARADEASRYFDRAQALRRAAIHEQRRAAYAASWEAQRDAIGAQQQRWAQAQAREADWRAWRDTHRDAKRHQWQREQSQRLAYAATVSAAMHAHRDPDSDRPRSIDRGIAGSDNRPMAAQREADARVSRQAAQLTEQRAAADHAQQQRQHEAERQHQKTSATEHARQAHVEAAAVHAQAVAQARQKASHQQQAEAQTHHGAVERAAHHAQEMAQAQREAQHGRQEAQKAAEAQKHAEATAHAQAVRAEQESRKHEQVARQQHAAQAQAANDHPHGPKRDEGHPEQP